MAGERQDGVGTGLDRAVDVAADVHAEKRQLRVGDRVDQAADPAGLGLDEPVVLTAKRHDADLAAGGRRDGRRDRTAGRRS